VNPITSFFAALSRSNLPEPINHVDHFQATEEFEIGASSRTPSPMISSMTRGVELYNLAVQRS
jgi:hypothetical protein